MGLFSRRPADPPLVTWGRDALTLRQLYSGLALVGATGSGKTTALEVIEGAILAHPARPGVLHCCVKADEADRAEAVARRAGRGSDVIRVTAGGRWAIDLFGYLLGPLGQTSEGVARFLDRLAGLAAGNFGSGDDKTWQVQATHLLTHALELFRAAGETPQPFALFEVLSSVPKDPAAAARDEFLTRTACGRLIARGQRRYQAGELGDRDRTAFARAVEYVLGYLPGLGDRFLGSVMGTAVTGLGMLLQPPFDALFAGPSTWTPDVLTEEGAVVILDLPAVHGPAAAVAQAAVVQLAQMFLLHAPGAGRRPVAIVRDEAQYLVCPEWDAKVQTVARSHGIVSVSAVQGIPAMVAGFGGTLAARVQADTFLGSHATHLVFNPAADAETRDHYVKLSGQTREVLLSGGQHFEPNPGLFDRLLGLDWRPSWGWSEQVQPVLPPEVFTALARGGPDHRYRVEAVLFQAGRRFATGHPFRPVAFRQTPRA
jgi:energy-coupling factor transporter ATP-binding protein EcfA2